MKAVVSLSLVLLAVALAEASNTDNLDADNAKYQKHATEEKVNNILDNQLANEADRASGPMAPPHSRQALTGNWSWVDQGAVTPPKEMGQYGCGYAFSAAAVLEGAYKIKFGKLYNLSVQEIVDCASGNKANQGCNGGDFIAVFTHFQKGKPLVSWDCYSYTSGTNGRSGVCQDPSCTDKVRAGPHVLLPPNNETALQHAIKNVGPVACGIDATPLKTYNGGVLSNPPSTINHVITVVGYATTPSDVPIWIVKNSWGVGWGDKGYFYVKRGVNALGIASRCGYASAAAAAR